MKLPLLLLACVASVFLAGCASPESAKAQNSPEHNTTFTQKAGDTANTANTGNADSNAALDDSTPNNSRGAEDSASTDRRAAARRSLGMGH